MLEFLGIFAELADVVVVLLFLLTTLKIYQRPEINLQINIIILSAIFLLPVMIFESLLYLDLKYQLVIVHIPVWLAKLFFFLGVTGFFIYVLHFFTVSDFPSLPLILVAIASGFALGSMMSSVQFDVTNTSRPISYDPRLGGLLFILTMNIYTILALLGFYNKIRSFRKQDVIDEHFISMLDLFAGIFLCTTPLFMLLVRIHGIDLPFHTIFLPTALGYMLHFVQYNLDPEQSGYPTDVILSSLIIIDTNQQQVLSGYSIVDGADQNKLQGMAILAIDNLMRQIMDKELSQMSSFLGNYGDIQFIKYRQYVLIATFKYAGQKMGRLLLSLLLMQYVRELNQNTLRFDSLVQKYLYSFTHKKLLPNEQNYSIDNDK